MTKKEYVLKVLDKVKEYRDKADMIKQYLLTHNDEVYINYMYEKCVNAIDITIKNKNENKRQELGIILNEIYKQEITSKKADEEDIQRLEKLLASL